MSTIEQLDERLHELEQQLARLKQTLASQISTRRLCVGNLPVPADMPALLKCRIDLRGPVISEPVGGMKLIPDFLGASLNINPKTIKHQLIFRYDPEQHDLVMSLFNMLTRDNVSLYRPLLLCLYEKTKAKLAIGVKMEGNCALLIQSDKKPKCSIQFILTDVPQVVVLSGRKQHRLFNN